MRSQIPVGRFFGIRTGLHYSWFLIALLMLLSFSAIFHRQYPASGEGLITAWALATTLLFFVSLLLHELSHCMVALHYGLRVREITLFALGGVSQIEGELPSAAAEFRIAIAGPLTSALIGVVCAAAARIPIVVAMGQPATMFSWLAYINLTIAAFNLLPGYPMDGGRVLRAFLWWRSGSLERATRTASRAATFLAIAFIAVGLIDFFRGGGLSGLWIAFLGWFLLQASRESYLEYTIKEELKGVRVRDVMNTSPATIDGRLSIQEFVDNELLRTGRRCFLVRENGLLIGMVTPHEIREVHRAAWPTTPIDRVMHPLEKIHAVAPETSLLDALDTMGREDLNQVPVLSDGRVEGVLSRAEVLAYLQTRADLRLG